MKNSNLALIISLSIVAVGVAGYAYSQNTSQQASMEPANSAPTEQTLQNDVTTTEPSLPADANMEESRYVEYTKAALDSAATTKRVLFFYASWCPTCIPADADFKENSSILPADVTVIRVNYNDPQTDQDEEALADKYGITYQHTFVEIDEQGNEVTKWNGGQTIELLKNIK